MAADKPINFAEHVQLKDLGIAPESITFANVTLESEKFVCVRESGASGNSVTIVDLNNINNVYVSPLTQYPAANECRLGDHEPRGKDPVAQVAAPAPDL